MNMDFEILILGSDANAYYMARCAYEAYHKKAHLIGKDRLAFTKYSNILTIEYQEKLWDEKEFVKILNCYAKEHPCKILVVSTNETYSIFLARNREKIQENLIYPRQDEKILESLTNKEKFYKTYKNSELVFPETHYFDVLKNTVIPSLKYPIVLKPSNVVEYNHLKFEDKHKIYKLYSEEEVEKTILQIKEAGYKDRLILQEFVQGDDSFLFDSVVYVDKKGKCKVISFAQIGLQERSKTMVGNAATLINGENTFDGNVDEMKKSILSFMEKLGMNGFYEFDMKYDLREKKFKVLEINARQGRCSYYITPLGANLVQVLVEDLIEKKELPFRDLKEKCLLSFVPKGIAKKYIGNEDFKRETLKLWKQRVSPMECKEDRNIKRFLMMKKRLWHYRIEYKNSYWEE